MAGSSRLVGAVAITLVTLGTSSCYVTSQGYHLIRHQIAAKPIERVRTGETSPAEDLFFDNVEAIRRYAIDEIGLNPGKAYRRYRRTERDHLVDVVSAAGMTSFERKEWWFPVVGSVPYKGFYRSKPARRLAEKLRSGGWDVVVRPVDAFSTLGFFSDPLYSFMVSYDEARLAELIIHEMAHATLWIKSDGSFNEGFAEFVGRVGSRDYLVARYGEDSQEVTALDDARYDRDRFREDIAILRERLEVLYAAAADDLDESDTAAMNVAGAQDGTDLRNGTQAREVARERVLAEKAEIIAAFQREFRDAYDRRYRTDRYRSVGDTDRRINNAWIDLFHTYSGDLPVFESFHAVVGDEDLSTTIGAIIQIAEEYRSGNGSDETTMIERVREQAAKVRGRDGREG